MVDFPCVMDWISCLPTYVINCIGRVTDALGHLDLFVFIKHSKCRYHVGYVSSNLVKVVKTSLSILATKHLLRDGCQIPAFKEAFITAACRAIRTNSIPKVNRNFLFMRFRQTSEAWHSSNTIPFWIQSNATIFFFVSSVQETIFRSRCLHTKMAPTLKWAVVAGSCCNFIPQWKKMKWIIKKLMKV